MKIQKAFRFRFSLRNVKKLKFSKSARLKAAYESSENVHIPPSTSEFGIAKPYFYTFYRID